MRFLGRWRLLQDPLTPLCSFVLRCEAEILAFCLVVFLSSDFFIWRCVLVPPFFLPRGWHFLSLVSLCYLKITTPCPPIPPPPRERSFSSFWHSLPGRRTVFFPFFFVSPKVDVFFFPIGVLPRTVNFPPPFPLLFSPDFLLFTSALHPPERVIHLRVHPPVLRTLELVLRVFLGPRTSRRDFLPLSFCVTPIFFFLVFRWSVKRVPSPF